MSNVLKQLISGNNLQQHQAHAFFSDVVNGNVEPALMASVLTALKIKGETPDEIAGAAMAIRQAATPFPKTKDVLVDCVGTGGDGANTINISTTSAIVAAACGLKVAKHGNRSVSSKSGSADLLEAFGVNLMMSPETAKQSIDQCNACFLFAPKYHTGFKYAGPVRATMGVRTLFNILGPLVNPSAPKVMLLGVYTPDLLKPMAEALQLTGVERAWVVHGSGLDEVAIHGPTQVIEINGNELISKTVVPADFGLPMHSLESIKGGLPSENADYSMAILKGKGKAAHRDAVTINTAALLYLSGKANNLIDACKQVQTVLSTAKAAETLKQMIEVSNG